jgi:hypothetical protein
MRKCSAETASKIVDLLRQSSGEGNILASEVLTPSSNLTNPPAAVETGRVASKGPTLRRVSKVSPDVYQFIANSYQAPLVVCAAVLEQFGVTISTGTVYRIWVERGKYRSG